MSDSLRPRDWGLPGFSVCGVLQVRILEWIGIPFSRGPSQPRDQTRSLALLNSNYFTFPGSYSLWSLSHLTSACSGWGQLPLGPWPIPRDPQGPQHCKSSSLGWLCEGVGNWQREAGTKAHPSQPQTINRKSPTREPLSCKLLKMQMHMPAPVYQLWYLYYCTFQGTVL